MIIGFCAFSVSAKALAVGEVASDRPAGAPDSRSVGQVAARRSHAIFRSPRSQRLRMRALSTGASQRGLVPISRMASASSMPAMVALNR
jgi:hypothetical protein